MKGRKRISKLEKEIVDISHQKTKLLDLRLESNIDDDVYEVKDQELSSKLARLKQEQRELLSLRKNQEDTAARLKEFRKILASG